jgi:hypothetical protein
LVSTRIAAMLPLGNYSIEVDWKSGTRIFLEQLELFMVISNGRSFYLI